MFFPLRLVASLAITGLAFNKRLWKKKKEKETKIDLNYHPLSKHWRPISMRNSFKKLVYEVSKDRGVCSLEGLMLKLKLQYFGHLMQRADSFEKTLTLGKIEGRRRRDDRGWDGWMASLTRRTWVWVNSRSWWWTGRPGVQQSMGSQRVGHDWVTELNWTC